MPPDPILANYQPPSVPATGTGDGGEKAPGKLTPDRKVWVNMVFSSGVFTAFQYLHAWTGFDPNILNPALNFVLDQYGAPHMDVTMAASILLGSTVAQLIPPSTRDSAAWLTEKAVRFANAMKQSPVKAMVVDDHTSEQAAKLDIAAGVVPPDIIAKRAV